MGYIYPTIEQAVGLHGNTLEFSGGGIAGTINRGQLESVLEHIRNDDYYPSFEEKLTHLCFSVAKFHCFQDGNKRLALAISAQMLLFNGYLARLETFIREMENIVVAVAEDRIDKSLLLAIITAFVRGEYDDDEVLKLRILDALTRP